MFHALVVFCALFMIGMGIVLVIMLCEAAVNLITDVTATISRLITRRNHD